MNNETYNVQSECEQYAQDALTELLETADYDLEAARESVSDWAHKTADSHEWAIYYYNAAQVIAQNNTDDGEQWLEEIYDEPYSGCRTIGDVHTRLAYAVMYCALQDAMAEALDNAPVWTVGSNLPGFMPDNSPDSFTDWAEARDTLWENIDARADEFDEEADAFEDSRGSQDTVVRARADAAELRELLPLINALKPDSEFGATAAGIHYFLDKTQ